MSQAKSSQDPCEVSFEEALAQLELIVRKLEEGQIGLSEALAAYEAGVRHLKQCYTALEAAERKIELLAGVDAAGNPITRPFDDEALTLEQKAESRSRRRSAKTEKPLPPPPAEPDIDEGPVLF